MSFFVYFFEVRKEREWSIRIRRQSSRSASDSGASQQISLVFFIPIFHERLPEVNALNKRGHKRGQGSTLDIIQFAHTYYMSTSHRTSNVEL
jgi:hypothetical protein